MKHQNNSLKKILNEVDWKRVYFHYYPYLAYEYFPRVFTSMYGYAFHLKKQV